MQGTFLSDPNRVQNDNIAVQITNGAVQLYDNRNAVMTIINGNAEDRVKNTLREAMRLRDTDPVKYIRKLAVAVRLLLTSSASASRP